ncbi:MAG: carbamoyltransferase HypF [Promethearchaeota archaeon]
MSIKTLEINITGIVQGIGFRPFLFNSAKVLGLNGYILNRGNAGVRLILQGEEDKLIKFLRDIKEKSPEISFIEDIQTKEIETAEVCDSLEILKSEQGRGISLTLPPDIALCDDCLREMRNEKLKNYYQYPFIACAACGPRFTTVMELPYDRERTTMINFPFCKSCQQEYSDFENRRFHAQTFACSVCGPNYQLYSKDKSLIQKPNVKEILLETSQRINNGEIAAIKGIGGVHLVCLADDDDVILKLRGKKGKRKYKPFALMTPNLKILEKDFHISPIERETLTSFRRPIVLLEKKHESIKIGISDWVAPGLHNIGIMLPYSGIHHLLFDYIGNKPLVYTSGNKSNFPMGIDNKTIFNQLNHLADFYLLHNRLIHQRADDSVLRIHDNKLKFIRRSRGYVPGYLPLPFHVDIPGALAIGPLLSTTGAVLRRNRVFPTQHIGNVSHLETYAFLKEALQHMKTLLQIKNSEIKFVACDAHPVFITTSYAKELSEELDIPLYPIQHHFAHALSLMVENKIQEEEEIVCITTDGVGYGDDGNVWGGEVIVSSYRGYERLCHLEYQPMIGGDRCTKYPARMVASILLNKLGIESSIEIFDKLGLEKHLEYGNTEIKTLISQFENAKGQLPSATIPLSSSTGRIFDSVSYILGVCNIKTYRGEPAMRLEAIASKGDPKRVELSISYSHKEGMYLINTSDLIKDIIKLKFNHQNAASDIAARFQKEMGEMYAEIAINIAREKGINKIGLTGGVAYNYAFSNTIKNQVLEDNLSFIEHNVIAPGDAGISTGQLIAGIFKLLNV